MSRKSPENPLDCPDGFENYHDNVLYRLVCAQRTATTRRLQTLYDALAPLLYQGVTTQPVETESSRRQRLEALEDQGRIQKHRTARGIVWSPTELPEDVTTPVGVRNPEHNGDKQPAAEGDA